jgi:hypothetical protein
MVGLASRHFAFFARFAVPYSLLAGSDINIMIEIYSEAMIGVWEHGGIRDFIAGLFDGPVDVVKRKTLNRMSVRNSRRHPCLLLLSWPPRYQR